MSQRGKKLDKHSSHGRFKVEVGIEEQHRTKPNTLYGKAYDCIGGEPLGNTSEASWLAQVIEYPLIGRESNRICDVILPKHVSHVQKGDKIYLRFSADPLFLDNRDWLPVTVTQIDEAGDDKIFLCGEDSPSASDSAS